MKKELIDFINNDKALLIVETLDVDSTISECIKVLENENVKFTVEENFITLENSKYIFVGTLGE